MIAHKDIANWPPLTPELRAWLYLSYTQREIFFFLEQTVLDLDQYGYCGRKEESCHHCHLHKYILVIACPAILTHVHSLQQHT